MLLILHLDVCGFREVRTFRILKLLIRLIQMICRGMTLHSTVRTISLYNFVALLVEQALAFSTLP